MNVTHKTCDVLVIGGGGAGVSAAITAHSQGAEVLMACKDHAGYGNTRIIGGIMAYGDLDPSLRGEDFFRDIVVSGEYLNNQTLCRILADEAPQATLLLEQIGALTGRDKKGTISADAMIQAGGHSCPRVLLLPSTGPGVGQGLRFGMARENIPVLEKTVIVDLLKDGDKVFGALGYQVSSGDIIIINAKQTILATGGGGWLYYPHTDTSQASTGDGFALALNAGAQLVDMEQVQFIPFSLTHPSGMVGCIVGEPFTAGPCGTLRNKHGDEILADVSTKTRAQVSNAIILEVEKGNGTEYGGCLLDLKLNKSHETGKILYHRYTEGIFKPLNDLVRSAYGATAARWDEPWDVYPTAHYSMGGITINEWGEVRGVENLFACGEVTGGVHGSNRLGGVSMTELFVFGKRAGQRAAALADGQSYHQPPQDIAQEPVQRVSKIIGRKGIHRVIEVKRRLQKTMWEAAGPVRDEERLTRGLTTIAELQHEFQDTSISDTLIYNTELMDALDVRHMLPVARAIIMSALKRTESRGAHVRLDFPDRDDAKLMKNVVVRKEGEELVVETKPVELKYLKP